jgi:hypothetical protein
MKLWNSFGSEHSANLVMIGRFKDSASAENAKTAIDELTAYMKSNNEDLHGADRYPDGVLEVLKKIKLHSVAPFELEQFNYDFSVGLEDDKLVIKTDEIDVSAFLKLMIDNGARVEVYSAHDQPKSGEKISH